MKRNFIALKYNPQSGGWWGVFRTIHDKIHHPPLGSPDWPDLDTALLKARELGFDPGTREEVLRMNPTAPEALA